MELPLPSPSLVVLIGPSASGKSTWAAETFAPAETVSSDLLRGMVGAGPDDQRAGAAAFDLLERIVAARVGRRLTTVIDTLGFDTEARRRWVALARDASMPAFAIVFDADADLTGRRNAERPRSVPKTVLARQHTRMKKVLIEVEDDGFDRVEHAGPTAPLIASIPAQSKESDVTPGAAAETTHSFGLMVNRFAWGGEKEDLGPRLASIAARAENAGFRDMWLMDHFRQIPRLGRPWEDIPEVYSALSYLAGMTDVIRLGCLVTSVTHRHPVILGKMLATLDVLSGGRANLGLGLGWDRKEHAGYGIDFPDVDRRYEMLEDTLRMLPLLWGKGSPSFEGRTFSAAELTCYPRPIQDRIPVTVGGAGETRTLRIVARYADACNVFGTPELVKKKVDILDRHCQAEGRDAAEIEVTHLVDAMTAVDRSTLRSRVDQLRGRSTTFEEFAHWHNAATVEDRITDVEAYRRAGATHSIVVLPDLHLDGSIEDFADVIEYFGRP
jgi:F420-dependent oxidoreductase-like protein